MLLDWKKKKWSDTVHNLSSKSQLYWKIILSSMIIGYDDVNRTIWSNKNKSISRFNVLINNLETSKSIFVNLADPYTKSKTPRKKIDRNWLCHWKTTSNENLTFVIFWSPMKKVHWIKTNYLLVILTLIFAF
jgi:hypothetical protein